MRGHGRSSIIGIEELYLVINSSMRSYSQWHRLIRDSRIGTQNQTNAERDLGPHSILFIYLFIYLFVYLFVVNASDVSVFYAKMSSKTHVRLYIVGSVSDSAARILEAKPFFFPPKSTSLLERSFKLEHLELYASTRKNNISLTKPIYRL